MSKEAFIYYALIIGVPLLTFVVFIALSYLGTGTKKGEAS